MRKALANGTLIVLAPYNNKEGSRSVTVKEVLGEGAGSIAYLVEEDSLQFVMKECFPYTGADRDSDGAVVWRSGEVETKTKSRFERAFQIQATLMRDLDAMNQTSHLAGSLYRANNTLCTLTVRKNAKTYDKVEESRLADILVTAKSVASIVGAYHKAGYLHLDIKPENIMVYPETREMVQMIDFDSIISISDKDVVAPSFSPKYAAPELVALDTEKLCQATDYYEIGAMVFEKVFGRAPESWDRSIFSDWTFPELYNGKSEKLKRLSREFFRKTLAAGVKERFQSVDKLIQFLNALIQESENEVFLVSTLPDSKNTFVGRERELCEITDAFERSGIVILNGIGGIGKTELALRYAKENRSKYDVVCFGRVVGSLSRLFDDPQSGFLSIKGESRPDLHGIEKINDLVDDRTLLIVDNLDSLDDPETEDLFKLNSKILITSRCDFHEEYPEIPQIAVGELSEENQVRLFISEAGIEENECDNASVRGILEDIDGYTLLIPLIAKLLTKSNLTLVQLQERIHSAGIAAVPETKVRQYKDLPLRGSVVSILKTVLDISDLSEEEIYVLKSMLLFEGIYIEKQGLLEEIGMEYNDAVNDLAEKGWLQLRGSFPHLVCSLHSIISQVFALENKPRLTEMKWVTRLCREYAEDCDEYCEQVLDGTVSRSVESIWDDPFWKPQDYDYLEENHIWRGIGEKGFFFEHRRNTIAALLQKCFYENEEDVECLLGILDSIVKKDLSRAMVFTSGTYGLDTFASACKSERLVSRCQYYLILFILKYLSHHRDGEQDKRAYAVDELAKLSEQYCGIVRDLPGMSIKKYFVSISSVLEPFFDLGSSYGIGIFERDWDPSPYVEINEETIDDQIDVNSARKFVGVVENLVKIVRVAFNGRFEEEKQIIEQRYASFLNGMSEEKYLDFQLHRFDAPSELDDDPAEYDKTSESYRAWEELDMECVYLARECMSIGFGQNAVNDKIAGMIRDKVNEEKAEQLLQMLEVKLKIESEMLRNGNNLPDFAEQMHESNMQQYRFGKFLLCMLRGEQDEAVSIFDDYFNTELGVYPGALEVETTRLALYKPYCDTNCVVRIARYLHERLPDHMHDVMNEMNPIELEIPEKKLSMQLENLDLELKIAEMMEDTELQNAIKQKINAHIGTNF